MQVGMRLLFFLERVWASADEARWAMLLDGEELFCDRYRCAKLEHSRSAGEAVLMQIWNASLYGTSAWRCSGGLVVRVLIGGRRD